MTDSPAVRDKALRMSYRIGRGEQGVLTFEPYKGALLPLWRFRTAEVARRSSTALWDRFEAYDTASDFVGMDMARKFIQMGMTRAKRYANHRGGRKYVTTPAKGKEEVKVKKEEEEEDGNGGDQEEEAEWTKRQRREQLPISEDHEGKSEKEEASLIFREVWERCRAHEGYQQKKKEFQEEQKEWDKEQKRNGMEKEKKAKREVKQEEDEEEEENSRTAGRRKGTRRRKVE